MDYPQPGQAMDTSEHPAANVPDATHHHWGTMLDLPMPINRDGADYNIRSGVSSGRYSPEESKRSGNFNIEGNWKSN